MIFSQSVSLLDLTKENQKDFNKRGLNCNIYLMDYESQSDETRYLFLVKCKEQYSKGSGHIVSLLFDKGSSKYAKPLSDDVKVHCQCPSFVYHGAAFNATNPNKGDSYNLDFTENRPPDVRDPFRQVKVCKHIATVRNKLRNITYKVLDKKVGIKATSEELSFPIVPIEESFGSVVAYIETFRKEINPIEFIASLDRFNYEEKLLSIGAII